MLVSSPQLHAALESLTVQGLTPYSFFYSLLQNDTYKSHSAVTEVINNVTDLLDAIASCSHPSVLDWAMQKAEEEYCSEISQLTEKEAGLQFMAKFTTDEKLRNFEMKDIARLMEGRAPRLWNLTYTLQDANLKVMCSRCSARQKEKRRTIDVNETWTETFALWAIVSHRVYLRS
ncbi:hypothetical protein JOM56_011493 [Amanita muscaria]